MTDGRRERDRPARARHAAHRRAGCCAACATSPSSTAPRASTRSVADQALRLLDVDSIGLDQMDRRYLELVAVNFGGGPVGIETIAAALSEPRDAIEDIIEPYLLQQGFLQRTPRGRLLTPQAFRHLGLAEPASPAAQFGLFGGAEEE